MPSVLRRSRFHNGYDLIDDWLWLMKNGSDCALGNNRFMKPTIVLWLIEIALGTYVYVLLYVPL